MSKKSFSMHPAIPADKKSPMAMDFACPFEGQVKTYFEGAGDLRGFNPIGLPGQAVAAALALPVLEMSIGLPTMYLFGFGQEVKVVGELNLDNYRHNQVRPQRAKCPEGEAFAGYTILDGAGRGVTPEQMTEIVAAVGTEDVRVINVSIGHVDPANITAGLVERLIGSGLAKADWTGGRILYLPPGFGPLAAVMITAIYGLSEVWPRTIRLNRRADGSFHADEIVDPQSLRQFGVGLVARWDAAGKFNEGEILQKILSGMFTLMGGWLCFNHRFSYIGKLLGSEAEVEVIKYMEAKGIGKPDAIKDF